MAVNVALAVPVAADGPIPFGCIVLIAAATGDWNGLDWPEARTGIGWVGPAATRGWRGIELAAAGDRSGLAWPQ